MRYIIKSLCCILLAIVLNGCAFTRTNVKVTLSTPGVNEPLEKAAIASLEVGEVKDSRLVTDPYVLMQKGNVNGATSGAYVTDRPVADIFRDGLTAALQKNGFISANTNRYMLKSDIQMFGYGYIQRMFSPGIAKPVISVRFELVDKTTGQPVWHDTYNGQDTEEATGLFEDAVVLMFSRTTEDVFRQLIADKAFRGYFEK
jgi:hypothetical protein